MPIFGVQNVRLIVQFTAILFDSEKFFIGTQCSSNCPANSQPHCAGDGKTYGNLCKLNVAKCRSGGTLRKLYPAPCRPKGKSSRV